MNSRIPSDTRESTSERPKSIANIGGAIALTHLLPLACVLLFCAWRVAIGGRSPALADLQDLLRLDPLTIGGDRAGAIVFLIAWHEISVMVCLGSLALGAILAPLCGARMLKPDYWPQLSAADRLSVSARSIRAALLWGLPLAAAALGAHRLFLWACTRGGGAAGAGPIQRLGLWLLSTHTAAGQWAAVMLGRVCDSSWNSDSGWTPAIPPLCWLLLCMVLPGLAVLVAANATLARRINSGRIPVKELCLCGYPTNGVQPCPECGRSRPSKRTRWRIW